MDGLTGQEKLEMAMPAQKEQMEDLVSRVQELTNGIDPNNLDEREGKTMQLKDDEEPLDLDGIIALLATPK